VALPTAYIHSASSEFAYRFTDGEGLLHMRAQVRDEDNVLLTVGHASTAGKVGTFDVHIYKTDGTLVYEELATAFTNVIIDAITTGWDKDGTGYNVDYDLGIVGTDIASSTNASPIVITSSAAHNLQTGCKVIIAGHTTNTAANGNWYVTRASSTTFSLDGSTGNGIGGNDGTIRPTGAGGTTYIAEMHLNVNSKSAIVLRGRCQCRSLLSV